MTAAEPLRRRSVRVAVFDDAGRLLLLRTRDPDRPDELWWELPGGGVGESEELEDAARRELAEETGIRVEALGRRVGVVETDFELRGERYRQTETVFELHVGPEPPVSAAALPAEEAAAHVGHRWWPADEELPRVRVHPASLAKLLAGGW